MINRSYITVNSSWGHDINNLYLAHSLEADDDYMKSIQILSEVTGVCADFVKRD